MSTNQRVLVIYDPRQAGITCQVRGFQFRDALAGRGWEMHFVAYTPPPKDSARRVWWEIALLLRAQRSDLVYLLKVSSATLVSRLRSTTTAPVIFDLTDALWREEIGGPVWEDLNAILTGADAVFTCNAYDTAYATRYNHRTFCLPPYADVERFARVRAKHTRRADGRVRIGWIGSGSTLRAIRHIAGPLEELTQRCPEIEFRLVGYGDPGAVPAFEHLPVSLGPPQYGTEEMIQEALNMDIGVFPLVVDEADYCTRGPLKALVYMAAAVPCVCFRAGECAQIIIDGQNGLLATSAEEWVTKLERLVRDVSFREAVGRAGLETVRAKFSLPLAIANLKEAFDSVARTPRTRPTWRALSCLACALGQGVCRSVSVVLHLSFWRACFRRLRRSVSA